MHILRLNPFERRVRDARLREQDKLLGTTTARGADIAGISLDYAKHLTTLRHPDTGAPVLTRESLERGFTETVNPFVMRVLRPGYGHPIQLDFTANLRTTAGKNWTAALVGGDLPANLGYAGQAHASTAPTATTFTAAGAPGWGTNQWAGHMVYVALTSSMVFGVILSNTATVLTIDQWYLVGSATGAVGTTPATSAQFAIGPGQSPAYWIAVSADAGAPAAGDTTLAGEVTNSDLKRALATYAFTGGTASFTYSKTFTSTQNYTNLQKAGIFTGQNGSTMAFENTYNLASLTGASGDQLAAGPWTVTL